MRVFPGSTCKAPRAALGAGLLRVDIRFGYRRGYCAELDEDDRPRLTIRFTQDRVSASFEDRTNCAIRNVALPAG